MCFDLVLSTAYIANVYYILLLPLICYLEYQFGHFV